MEELKKFLNGRTKIFSYSLPVFIGVSQGWVIDPLLFIIYINDFASEVDNCNYINLFTEDENIFSQYNQILQSSLNKMYH